jgi:hypothetical protein
MLRLCRLSGCGGLLFGLESVSSSSLMGMEKTPKSIEETEEGKGERAYRYSSPRKRGPATKGCEASPSSLGSLPTPL